MKLPPRALTCVLSPAADTATAISKTGISGGLYPKPLAKENQAPRQAPENCITTRHGGLTRQLTLS